MNMLSIVAVCVLTVIARVTEAQSNTTTLFASNAVHEDIGMGNGTTSGNATFTKYIAINATVVINEESLLTTVEGRQFYGPALPSPYFPTLHRNVAFSVRKATETLRAFTHLHFRDVLTNIGESWDPDTSEFVAPYHGGYFFQFHAVGGRNSDFTLALTKNSVYQVTAYGTRQSFEHGSNSVFLELRYLDRISLELQQGVIYEHPGNEAYTTFTGFMLFAL